MVEFGTAEARNLKQALFFRSTITRGSVKDRILEASITKDRSIRLTLKILIFKRMYSPGRKLVNMVKTLSEKITTQGQLSSVAHSSLWFIL